MEFAAELQASLKEFTATGAVEVRENGGRVASFAGMSWEVRGSREKPLLHLWSEQLNLTRRVLAITDHSEQRLALAVERFGRAKPNRLEFIRKEFEPDARELSREDYRNRLRHVLAEQFPDETVESLTVSADLEHSLSGNYVRGVLRRSSFHFAVLAVDEAESSDTAENSLTFGLLWLQRTRHLRLQGTGAGLRLILPKAAVSAVAHRLKAIEPQLPIELFEQDMTLDSLHKVDIRRAANLHTWLIPRRESETLVNRARPDLEPILTASPPAVSVHPSTQAHEVWLRFRGLPFARWKDGQVTFGTDGCWERLNAATRPALRHLLKELEVHRHPLAENTRHALYRAHPERWLESLVQEDVTRVDAALDPRFVYAQVFANIGDERGILDLLTVTRSGRLAILELKASEHIHLTLQAADYWLRVRKHQENGDFARYGYFPGIELQSIPPIVYLVAPALRFHPATDDLLKCLCREIEVVRVGMVESWRRGLRVMMRM